MGLLRKIESSFDRERPNLRAMKPGRKPRLAAYQQSEVIKRRDQGEETLAEIGRSCNVSGWTTSRLTA
ncbi:MAG: hypothetical protein ACRECP_07230 [Methylocella sp.]